MNKYVPYIPLSECVERVVYKIHSRNLILGVFDGQSGFIGIREKFGYEYLFTEYHWDSSPSFGTVRPYEKLGMLDELCENGAELQLIERDPLSYCIECDDIMDKIE